MEDESISALLCQENRSCLEKEEPVDDEDAIFIDITMTGHDDSDSDGEDEFVKILVDREISLGFRRDPSMAFDSWIKYARLEAITWILKTRAIFGFSHQTAYLSITYFDRFLSRRFIDGEKSWAIRLLAVACLSLAVKMEEIQIPLLSEFQIEEYNFESRVIQKMELSVLNTLGWRMISITPFTFLHYFIIRFCKDSPSRQMVAKTQGFILAAIREINLMDHRPSAIAAAATLLALDQGLNRKALECKMDSISCSGSLEIEDVFQCYHLMQKLEMVTPKFVKLPDLLPAHLRTVDVCEGSPVTSVIRIKRKRLTFSNSE